MNKIISLFTVLLYSLVYGQSHIAHYEYIVKNTVLNNSNKFSAKLHFNNSGERIYTTRFGIDDQFKNADENNTSFFLSEKGSYDYVLFSNSKNAIVISDKINGKQYLFNDNIHLLTYDLKNENKMVGEVKLNKAETEFRGRKFTIWYDASSKIKSGPWKFDNLPGLAYEIYDDEKLFHWTLKTITKSSEKVVNPFVSKNAADFLSYNQFPKLKYTTKIFIRNPQHPNGVYQDYEQKRDGLEKTFEWEN